MKDFGDFNIKPEVDGLIGNKISIQEIFNVPVVIEKFTSNPSKFQGKSDCINLQIIINNQHRVVFVSSKNLLKMLDSIPKDGFPFRAIIAQDSTKRIILKSAINNS